MPLCGTTAHVEHSIGPSIATVQLNVEQVKEFLKKRPDVLEEYLISNVNEEFLIQVLWKKKADKSALACACDTTMPGRKIAESKTDAQLYEHLYSIVSKLARVVRACAFYMYVISDDGLGVYEPDKNVRPVEHFGSVPAYVAMDKMAVNVSAPRLKHDPRFNKGIGPKTGYIKLCHTVAVPVLKESAAVFAIIQFERPQDYESFSRGEFAIICSVLGWISSYMKRIKMDKNLRSQMKLNEHAPKMFCTLFDHWLDDDAFKAEIATVAKELVSYDKCTLQFMDKTRPDRTGHLADQKSEEDKLNNNVAVTSKDAPENNLHKHAVDQDADNKATSMLSVPIVGGGDVLAVLRMIRLGGNSFTPEEEDLLQLFAGVCSPVIGYHRIYERFVQKEAKFQAALGFLQHNPVDAIKDATEFEIHPYDGDEEISQDSDLDFDCFENDANVRVTGSSNFKNVLELVTESDIDIKQWEMGTNERNGKIGEEHAAQTGHHSNAEDGVESRYYSKPHSLM